MRWAAATVLTAACVTTPLDEQAQEAVIRTCTLTNCGANSPQMLYRNVLDLHVAGEENADRIKIVSFKKGSTTYELDVEGGRIIGTAGATTIKGAALAGSILTLKDMDDGAKFAVRIAAVNTVPMWATVPAGTMPPADLETYVFEWKQAGSATQYQNLCSNPPAINGEPTLGMDQNHAVVFEGDRINPDTISVYAVEDGWFNIGCAGHALAKLFLTGYVEATASMGLPSTLAERTTMLKALAADYCGTGHAFTVAGVPLEWIDARGSLHYTQASFLEARWGPQGAVCLEDPRAAVSGNALALEKFPDILSAISEVCALPPTCSSLHGNTDTTWFAPGTHVVTANPQ